MMDPGRVAGADHMGFVSGNDPHAKARVALPTPQFNIKVVQRSS
jgi:hypothetical protein